MSEWDDLGFGPLFLSWSSPTLSFCLYYGASHTGLLVGLWEFNEMIHRNPNVDNNNKNKIQLMPETRWSA